MKPIIEPVKTDRIADENFDSLRTVLCGNISFDNMSVRILEGTTKGIDEQNLVVHSGNRQPVGWFPLVGDVYVQEINETHIDVRSTKPQAAYKIIVLFGAQITESALKAIGGPEYKNTEEVAEDITIEQIQAIQEIRMEYKPLAIESSILPNPCPINAAPSAQYHHILAGSDHFYLCASTPAARNAFVWRINRTTGAVDSIDLTGTLGVNPIAVLHQRDQYIYAAGKTSLAANTFCIIEIDTSTFAVTTTWTLAGISAGNIRDIYVNDDYIYWVQPTLNARQAYAQRVKRSDSSLTEISIVSLSGGIGETYTVGNLQFVPGDATTTPVRMDALYVATDNNFKASGEVTRIEIKNPSTGAQMFAVSDTLTSTGALGGLVSKYSGGYLYVPVIYSAAHMTAGGNVAYLTGVAKIDAITSPYTATFIPIDIETQAAYITYGLYEDVNGLYMIIPMNNGNYGIGTRIIALLKSGEVIHAFVNLASSGQGTAGFNNFAAVEPSGELILIKNTSAVDACNFVYASVDISDYL